MTAEIVRPRKRPNTEGRTLSPEQAAAAAMITEAKAYPATKTDKTTICRFLRLDWDTIARICQRVAADHLDRTDWTAWSRSASTRCPGVNARGT